METSHRFLFQSATNISDVASGSVDLVVTSPPYPMIEMWDETFAAQDDRIRQALSVQDGPEAFELMHQLLDLVWKECYRTLRPGGFACVNIGDATRKVGSHFRLYTNHSRITSFCESVGLQSLPAILWRKQTNAPNKFMGSGMLPAGAYVTLEHEYILVFRKGGKRAFGEKEKCTRQRSAIFWEERNVWFSDMWDFKGTRQTLGDNLSRQRSAAFPFELAFRLIQMYSLQEDTVLDPFAGTGTTTIAAMASGRNSLSIELDAALAPVIESTVQTASTALNERQRQRIRAHRDFVEKHHDKHGRELAHMNLLYNFPVMTRQEVTMSVPIVEKIKKDGAGEYHVYLGQLNEGIEPVETDGFPRARIGEAQPGLFFDG